MIGNVRELSARPLVETRPGDSRARALLGESTHVYGPGSASALLLLQVCVCVCV